MRRDFVPLPHRKPLRWPGGARRALIATANLGYWDEVGDSPKPYDRGGPGIAIARVFRIRALRDFLRYARGSEGAWFATRAEIADWYLENHAGHI